jgi:hypothetical protein
MSRRRTITTLLVVAVVAMGACSSDDGDDPDDGDAADEQPVQVDRPEGPAAEISGPLTGGGGINLAAISGEPDLEEAGWVEEEYAAEGSATSYL